MGAISVGGQYSQWVVAQMIFGRLLYSLSLKSGKFLKPLMKEMSLILYSQSSSTIRDFFFNKFSESALSAF